MQYKKEGNILVAKLSNGSDLFEALRGIMNKIDEKSAMIVSGIGMIRDFKLGYYNSQTGEYEWKEYQEPMELLSLKGSLTEDGSIHVHALVGGEDHNAQGGHLDGGKVFNVNEITMLVFKDIRMTRELDKEVDMELLAVK